MVTIATFNEPAKAKHLKDTLQQAGVKADIHNEAHLQTVAFMSKPQANAKVMVDEDDFEAAHKLDGGMGSEPIPTSVPQSVARNASLPAHRISAADAQVPHPGAGGHSFRAENFPEGILLPGLPFHLDERTGTCRAIVFGTGSFPARKSRHSGAVAVAGEQMAVCVLARCKR